VSCRRAIVEELAGLGVSVYTCARSGDDLEKSLATWRAAGWKVEGSVCDVSDRQAREELFSKVAAHFGGKLDILVSLKSWSVVVVFLKQCLVQAQGCG
jgi:Tropinone reductase 1